MDIQYKDIDVISYALCYANALLCTTIEDLEKKGFNDVAEGYYKEKEEVKKAMNSLQKIRKELHLKDDYAYNEKFRK